MSNRIFNIDGVEWLLPHFKHNMGLFIMKTLRQEVLKGLIENMTFKLSKISDELLTSKIKREECASMEHFYFLDMEIGREIYIRTEELKNGYEKQLQELLRNKVSDE